MNGTVNQTAWTDPTITAGATPVKVAHFNELRAAIDNLDNLKGNVTNCGYNPCQSCQSQYCQSCQSTSCQSCQGCQTCQACQAMKQC